MGAVIRLRAGILAAVARALWTLWWCPVGEVRPLWRFLAAVGAGIGLALLLYGWGVRS